MKTEELKNSGLLRIKSWEPEGSENGNGQKEILELPGSEELVKLKVQETLGTLLGARVQVRENDVRLLSIQQELRNLFEKNGRTGVTEDELTDYVRHYFRIRKS